MTDGIRMLKESSVELDHAEPGDSTKKVELLQNLPFARREIEEFLSRVERGKLLVAPAYDPTGGAVILMRAAPLSDKTRVTVHGFKNASRAQYDKFIADADLSNLTGTMAIKLAAEEILDARIP